MSKAIHLLFLVLLMAACNGSVAQPEKVIVKWADSLQYETIADTIVCDMVVRNPYAEDKMTSSWLDRFQRKAFLDTLLSDIYKGRIIAYDFETGKALSPRDVRELENEPGYNRDIVGKFQFKEVWKYDRHNHVLTKKVHSIIFGYETYDQDKLVKGYKPLFKVIFN